MLTIHAAANDIRRGRLSPVDLLESCLGRMDRLEQRVGAWAFLDRERAQGDARRLEAELKQGRWRGPLHGIPLGIKDIIDVFDWPTAAGSKRWARTIARRDATATDRLRQAGAVLVGKTVTTAYASYDPPPTRNPWDAGRTPGGSSSGSAAAVACGMCLGALGTQTGGSITRPASYCGVASCKPTLGRVSLDGVLPLAPSMDHVGPMAATVADLALLLQTIAGFDPRDPACSRRPVPDWLAGLATPSPPRLGRLRGYFDSRAESEVLGAMDGVVTAFRRAGAAVEDVALPARFADVDRLHRTVMAVEAAAYHESRLRRHPDDYPPQVSRLLEEGLACPATDYARCKENQWRLAAEMAGCFGGFDALLSPATTGPAPEARSTGDAAFNVPWSYTGLPTVSVPAAWTAGGLPLAVQLVAPRWHEGNLFSAASWCEQILALPRRDPIEVR
jgi:aspartyl-tRNA(Asn)/glutamyl-tRNA(Gln) amidotransferase subunit A